MRVDFYHLTRDPAEALIPRLAENTLQAGERLLVVSDDGGQLDRISRNLWTQRPESFLAHGRAGQAHEDRQPILLGSEPAPANGARFLAIADGRWRDEAAGFARVFYLFDEAGIAAARTCWRELRGGSAERHYWKQQGGRWLEGP